MTTELGVIAVIVAIVGGTIGAIGGGWSLIERIAAAVKRRRDKRDGWSGVGDPRR